MQIVALITGLLKLANWVAQFAAERQLLNAGEAKAIAERNQETLNALEQIAASRRALADPGTGRSERLRDKFRRD